MRAAGYREREHGAPDEPPTRRRQRARERRHLAPLALQDHPGERYQGNRGGRVQRERRLRDEDAEVLTGRFGNGEYWNGFRDDAEAGSSTWRLANVTPRETLRSLLLAANAAIYTGDVGALQAVNNLVTYAGPSPTAGDRTSRQTVMFALLDMSTLRIMDVPETPAAPDVDEVRFAIGPAGTPEETELLFQRNAAGQWQLVLPDVETLSSERAKLLAALGYTYMEELNQARADSPRAALREFIQGVDTWHDGGSARALAVMDLSHIPQRLRVLEGPVYADTLKWIRDRIAYVIWQEIPDDPARSVPYVYFQHPVGDITIAWVTEAAATGPQQSDERLAPRARWKIASSILVSAPALLDAMRDLPPIPGLEDAEALSPYFRLREGIRASAPSLVEDWGYLEAWQWLGLLSACALALAGFSLARAAFEGLGRLRGPGGGFATLSTAAGLVVAAGLLSYFIARLGLTQVGLPVIGTLLAVFLTLALAFFAYRLVTIVGGWFIFRAEQTKS